MNLANSRRRALVAPAVLMATLAAASTAAAQMEWTGSMSDSWFVGTNWNPAGPPGGTDDVVIDTDNPNATVIGLADADARQVTVGDAGTGHLTIRNGNALNNSNVARIGRFAGADGTVVVTDLGTTWSNGSNLQVGSAGEGHLLITNSAQVSNNQAFVGLLDGGMGYVTVTGAGSVWDNGFDLWVAQTGTGTVNIEDGGTVTSPSGFLALQPEGNGTVMVTGSGSAWTMTGELTVGSNGTGTLTIEDQGLVSNTAGVIGGGDGSSGMVTVTGAGSSWDNSAQITVGDGGTGTLIVEDGAAVNSAFGGSIAREEGSEGMVTVSGAGSIWSSIGGVTVGWRGAGWLTIESGGQVSVGVGALGSTQLGIGFFSFSEGTVTVTGAGSNLTVAHNLLVAAQQSTGTMTVEDGSVVDVGEAALIGQSGNSQGNVTVTGPGSTWNIGGDLTVGGHNFATANLAIGPDAAVNVGGTVIVAEVANPGGCDCALYVDGNLSSVDGTLINPDSLLTGAGFIGGGATTIAGTVAPGSPVGTLSTRELVFEPTAVLEFELDEPGGTYDAMSANGDLTLDGTLLVTDLGGFGEGTYTLIEYTGTLTDNTLAVGSLPAGFTAAIDTSTTGEVRLVVEAQSDDVFSDRFES